ncbi:hypothetical protein PGT21_018616 [Puccinia graminis f. sp. tritici]|uniref:STAS domain-containing protein n=1 Tax=Puccinia graminis f. sp. tritici TaxID=56615 RepID=A0A5B0QP50_PUCGR|nr:hypothetical protein PGT21_018616 [Puccinia graminis f. sp. tritici]
MRFRILGRDLITRTWEPINTKKTKSEEVAREIEEESPDALIIVEIRVTQFCDLCYLSVGYKKSHPSAKREGEDTRMVLFHLGDVDKIDISALQVLKEILQEYIDWHVVVWICHIKPSRYELFKKAGIVSIVGEVFRGRKRVPATYLNPCLTNKHEGSGQNFNHKKSTTFSSHPNQLSELPFTAK